MCSVLTLQEYDFDVVYKKCFSNVIGNGSSRLTVSLVHSSAIELDKVWRKQRKAFCLRRIVAKLKKKGIRVPTHTLKVGLIYRFKKDGKKIALRSIVPGEKSHHLISLKRDGSTTRCAPPSADAGTFFAKVGLNFLGYLGLDIDKLIRVIRFVPVRVAASHAVIWALENCTAPFWELRRRNDEQRDLLFIAVGRRLRQAKPHQTN